MIQPVDYPECAESGVLRKARRLFQLSARLTLVLLCVHPAGAHADGGHVALRATSGGCSITLFTAPEPLVTGPVDLSLLVEDAGTGEIIADAAAEGRLVAAPAMSDAAVGPIDFSMTHELASNKLLLAAVPNLPRVGRYTLVLRVHRRGGQPVAFSTVLVAAQDHRRSTTLLVAILLPLLAILLFLVNQQAKLRRHRAPALH